jgi:predicted Fe-Mo cluster-binding NifX family protein/DNA-binding PadR family transcriptional regulator
MEYIENCLRDEEQLDCRRHIRGFLEPCLLLMLHLNDSYGYDLATAISTFGLGKVDSSLVYRMLRDLETAGLVDSQWEVGSSMGPARRVYRITRAGESHLDDWIRDLRNTDRALHYFLQVYDCHMLASQNGNASAGGRGPEIGQDCAAVDDQDFNDDANTTKGGKANVKKVVVSSNGYDWDAPVSPVFGRCAVLVFVDVDTMEFEALDNPAASAGGGAGIQAAQFVIEKGAQAALTGNVGPNAFDVFRAADFPVYLIKEAMTVRQAVERFNAGQLETTASPNVKAHAGMRQAHSAPAAAQATASQTRQKEITELQSVASGLRRQLADVMTRIEALEETS